MNLSLLQDKAYCLKTNPPNENEPDEQVKQSYKRTLLKYKLSIVESKEQPLNINIKNNIWSCDCQQFEILFSIINIQSKLDNLFGSNVNTKFDSLSSTLIKYSKSCYLNMFISQNEFIFNNLIFYLNIYNIFDLYCTNLNASNSTNWFNWYNLNCLIKVETVSGSRNENKTIPIPIKASISPVTSPKTQIVKSTTNNVFLSSTIMFSVPFYFSSTYPSKFQTYTNANNNKSQTVKPYDASVAFYWISSICVAIIVFSCLFIGWFYCVKKYQISRRIIRFTQPNSRRGQSSNRRPNNASTTTHNSASNNLNHLTGKLKRR
jgi:hypothetical protein